MRVSKWSQNSHFGINDSFKTRKWCTQVSWDGQSSDWCIFNTALSQGRPLGGATGAVAPGPAPRDERNRTPPVTPLQTDRGGPHSIPRTGPRVSQGRPCSQSFGVSITHLPAQSESIHTLTDDTLVSDHPISSFSASFPNSVHWFLSCSSSLDSVSLRTSLGSKVRNLLGCKMQWICSKCSIFFYVVTWRGSKKIRSLLITNTTSVTPKWTIPEG